ncbi:MAG: type I asparaginase [Thalassolituus sp.]|uniref:type I asparaginase n=1 Tax=Thalassolituus sp. TaxID=2030822 RepID=UPI003981D785
MQQRILILHTGGTIGMEASTDGYRPAQNFSALLAEKLHGYTLPVYDLVQLDTLIDSADLCPNDWSRIALSLTQQWHNYDGFIVLHGTDTMAYTASALSFILQEIDKPVILTGSQIPLNTVRTDALNNLLNSLFFAVNSALKEVCICFDGRLLRGNRSTKVNSASLDAFDSPNLLWLGEAGVNIQLNNRILLPAGLPNFRALTFDSQAVAMLTLFPGIQANMVEQIFNMEGLKGIILRNYGVGNVPSHNSALMQVIEEAVKRGIVVVNVSQCLAGGVFQDTYASGSVLSKIGVTSGSDMTAEAAFTKLHYLFACDEQVDVIRSKIPMSLRGECR